MARKQENNRKEEKAPSSGWKGQLTYDIKEFKEKYDPVIAFCNEYWKESGRFKVENNKKQAT
jgi:hypothetical protein